VLRRCLSGGNGPLPKLSGHNSMWSEMDLHQGLDALKRRPNQSDEWDGVSHV